MMRKPSVVSMLFCLFVVEVLLASGQVHVSPQGPSFARDVQARPRVAPPVRTATRGTMAQVIRLVQQNSKGRRTERQAKSSDYSSGSATADPDVPQANRGPGGMRRPRLPSRLKSP